MSNEDKETLIELLDDYMWSQSDVEITMQIQQLIEKIQEEIP